MSLHGTGGAWLVADETADPARFLAAVSNSVDRKVCNTLNVCCIVEFPRRRAWAAFSHGRWSTAGFTKGSVRTSAASGSGGHPRRLAHDRARSRRGHHAVQHPFSAFRRLSDFGRSHGARRLADQADAAFIGDGFTRWVDGQYAYNRPELGLSNWQGGRLFARGGVLSGDGVFTLKTRMRQRDMSLRR